MHGLRGEQNKSMLPNTFHFNMHHSTLLILCSLNAIKPLYNGHSLSVYNCEFLEMLKH
jgi:hypothetical protein